MFAIASLLEQCPNQQTLEIWQLLENNCQLSGIKATPFPHFSWQSADCYDLASIEKTLSEFVKYQTEFRVHGSGLGIFPGSKPVLFLNIIKNQALIRMHQELWSLIGPFGNQLNPYYSPDRWVPHITLAHQDLTPENIPCAIKDLVYTPIEFDITVNHLAVLYADQENAGIQSRFNFGSS